MTGDKNDPVPIYMCRQNQELEQDSYAMHEEAVRLQKEASALQEHLQAVLHDKFHHQRNNFDAETPIDKALNFLSLFIAVRSRR